MCPRARRTIASTRSCWPTRCARTGRGCGRWSPTPRRCSRCGRRSGSARTWSAPGPGRQQAPRPPAGRVPRRGRLVQLAGLPAVAGVPGGVPDLGARRAPGRGGARRVARRSPPGGTAPRPGCWPPGCPPPRPAPATPPCWPRSPSRWPGPARAAARIRAVEDQIAAQLAACPDGRFFTSLPRAGTVRAARLLAEIGDCRARYTGPPPWLPPRASPRSPASPANGKAMTTGTPSAPTCATRSATSPTAPAAPAPGPPGPTRPPAPAARTTPRRPHPRPRLDRDHLALLARRRPLRPGEAPRPAGHPPSEAGQEDGR